MILTKEIEIGINYKNIEHFKNLGYDVKCSERIVIPISDLSEYSNVKIKVKCDVCGNEKIIKYQSYVNGTKHFTEKYCCCTKCAWKVKNRVTNMKKYGYDSHNKTNESKEKYRQTCLNKYGVDNYSKTEEFKDKYENAMINKYGVKNGFQSEEIKQKSVQTMINKYGVEYNTQRQEIKEKFLLGENNVFYIDGRYETYDNNEWNNEISKRIRTKVFIRDNRTCDCCGSYNDNINAHHLYSRNTHKDLIYDLDNIITLCYNCHTDFHKKYGYGDNTKEQYYEFKQYKLESVETIESK